MKKKEKNLKPEINDIILVGKFKNKKVKITGFGIDKNNQPTVKTKNSEGKGKEKEKSLFNFRIKRLMDEDFIDALLE